MTYYIYEIYFIAMLIYTFIVNKHAMVVIKYKFILKVNIKNEVIY